LNYYITLLGSYPYQSKKIKALKKEPKLYFWDWSEVPSLSARLENMVASHLLKFCDYLYDSFGEKVKLFYIRDVDKREVDFLVTYKNQPWFAVEVKRSETHIDRSIKYFKEKLAIPFCYQVVGDTEEDYTKDGIRVIPLSKFLALLV